MPLTRDALWLQFFKHVVFHIERFAKVCAPESKLSALYVGDRSCIHLSTSRELLTLKTIVYLCVSTNSYVIDSILQASKAKLPDNVYAERFAKNILDTFWNIFEAPQEEHVRRRECDTLLRASAAGRQHMT